MLCLPFELNPIMQGYQYTAFPMSIIQGNAKSDLTPWLCGKHINCCYNTNQVSDKYSMSTCVSECYCYCRGENVLKFQHISFEKETYEIVGLNLIEFVKRLIQTSHYICGHYDEYYIKNKSAYNKFHYRHDYILFGYDDEKQIFYSAGYTNRNIYEGFNISYDDYLKSLVNLNEEQIEFNIWRYNFEFEYKFDLKRVLIGFENYINSNCTKETSIEGYVYGINSLRLLKQNFEEILRSKDENIDIRYTRNFVEHQYLMLMRLKYISQKIICDLNDIANEYEKIYSKALLIHNNAIKYNIMKNKTSVELIVLLMDEIINYEENNLSKFYKALIIY